MLEAKCKDYRIGAADSPEVFANASNDGILTSRSFLKSRSTHFVT